MNVVQKDAARLGAPGPRRPTPDQILSPTFGKYERRLDARYEVRVLPLAVSSLQPE